MKFLKILGIIVIALVVLVVVLGLIAPKKYHVERTMVIDAPKELVWYQVKYWRNWYAWLPWAKKDTTMQCTVVGNDGEIGSKYQWVGDPKITGKGEMTNSGIKENEELLYHLHFIEPWESVSEGYVRLTADNGKTKVAWAFYGKNPFPWNIIMLFMNLDKMVGPDYEQGLTLLKDLCEKAATAVRSYEIKKVDFCATTYAAVRKELSFAEIKNFFAASYGLIAQTLKKSGKSMIGAPVGLYFAWDEGKMTSDLAAGIPIRGTINVGEVKSISEPSSTAYTIDYFGPYERSEYAHRTLDLYLVNNGLKYKSPVIEEYLTDPSTEPDSNKWLTRIYYLVE